MRAIFASDPHYGYQAADVEAFTNFILKAHDALCSPKIYLVGDILDSWAGAKHCPATWLFDNTIIQGNHDPVEWRGMISVPWAVHTAKTGVRLLVIHGHQFDPQLHWGPLAWPLAILGTRFNEWLLCKLHFSLAALVAEDASARLKLHGRLAQLAATMGCDGVLSGHTHVAGETTIMVKAKPVIVRDCGCWLRGIPHGYWAENDEGTIAWVHYESH